ncbi:unnamed protein product [Vitrella brassicaformis CCMP3155]|uniref:C2 domain-containing protein n=2 Tax=Vitrella brassicaformis TaxID=1169539 RepID=A0A0G4EK03_VITBC|nr:unnamed protein product [Vitrella brassicaformis CCMP3155]|eukprot:CEL96872.1 unnamed protein product [Vitrella brassicaformis CCMP3155]
MAKRLDYVVKVEIFEVQDLRWTPKRSNVARSEMPNPMVEVTVAGETRATPRKKSTASCPFQQTFLFSNVSLDRAEFQRPGIEIKVLHATFFKQEMIGMYSFSYEMIYRQNEHFLSRQWVALAQPDRPSEPKGFLKVSLGVFGPGDQMPTDEAGEMEDDSGKSMMDRVLATPELRMTYYHLCVNVHKGQDIAWMASDERRREAKHQYWDPFVTVRFLGVNLSTEVFRNTQHPNFNQTIKLPAVVPCMENTIQVEVWDFEESGKHNLIGKTTLGFSEIVKQALEPRWVNFYWHPPAEGFLKKVAGMMSAARREPTSYGGRILISASVQKMASPTPEVVKCAPVTEPELQEYELWVDLYEVSGVAVGGNLPTEVQVEVQIGPKVIRLPALKERSGAFIFKDKDGRMEAEKLFLPEPSMSYDLIINLYTKGIWGLQSEETAYVTLPVRQMMQANFKPRWYSLKPVRSTTDDVQKTGGFLLASCICIPASQIAARPRKPRMEYRLSRYVCRTFLYQAVNLPISDVDGLSDPYVKVSLAGESRMTKVIKQALMPCWFEALEFELSLPENLALAPDLLLEVYDCDWIGSDELLGSLRYPLNKIPKEWLDDPKWFDIEGEQTQAIRAKILCSFELVPKKEIDSYPFCADISPRSKFCTVDLFVMGVRLHSSVVTPQSQPLVEVCYGRDSKKTEEPLWADATTEPEEGAGGKYNYLETMEIEVDLYKNPIYQSNLEVTVLDRAAFGHVEIGHAYIHLNPFYP